MGMYFTTKPLKVPLQVNLFFQEFTFLFRPRVSEFCPAPWQEKNTKSTRGFQNREVWKGEVHKGSYSVKPSSHSAHREVLLRSLKGMLDLRLLVSKLFSQENLTRQLYLPAAPWTFPINNGKHVGEQAKWRRNRKQKRPLGVNPSSETSKTLQEGKVW